MSFLPAPRESSENSITRQFQLITTTDRKTGLVYLQGIEYQLIEVVTHIKSLEAVNQQKVLLELALQLMAQIDS